ncbi:MAG: hypothetical protein ACLR8Y_03115 [Alistipes indistinctus]
MDGPLPMSECHRVWVPAENSSCNLFITRAAVKFSVLITNESGRALTLAGLAIDKMLRQEYYLPKNAQYEIREGNVREITVYDVPSTGDNNGYYTFKRTYGNGVTLMAGEEKNLDPIYLLEGKYSDHTAGTGENGVPLNYSMNISLAEVGGEPQKNEYLTNLPQLPRSYACGGSCYHPGQQRNKLDRRCRALRTSDSRADFRIITTNKTKQEKGFVTENSGHNMKRKIVYGLLCMLLVGITACTKDDLPYNGELDEGESNISAIVEFRPLTVSALGRTRTAGDAIKNIEKPVRAVVRYRRKTR